MEKGEIVLYQPDDSIRLEVRVDDDTVWLNRQQMSELFDRDVKTIGKHVNNALAQELKGIPTIANFATIQKEGDRWVNRNVDFYNLDMILSVSVILIDNYINESVLLMLAKRNDSVSAKIVTQHLSNQIRLDLSRHNSQYPPIGIEERQGIHDRFLILDETVYHLGASLKDLGKKLFAFSKLGISKEVLL